MRRDEKSEAISRRRALAALAGGAFLMTPTGGASAEGWLDEALRVLGGGGRGAAPGGTLSLADATAGVKEALSLATTRTIERVGRRDGFFLDQAIRIPLPGVLRTAQSGLRLVGASGLLDDLELRLNRSAEAAAPAAKSIFFDAIRTMSIEDAIGIVRGPKDSATRYFEGRMTPPLTSAFRPIIADELEDAGAFGALERAVSASEARALAPAAGSYARRDLVEHGLGFALSGLFHYLAAEEAAIRTDPLKRSSDLLRRVFG